MASYRGYGGYDRDDDRVIKTHVILTCVLIVVGIIAGVSYYKYLINESQRYRLATKIADDNDLYDYCMSVNQGESLVHGTVTADVFTSFAELGNQPYLKVTKYQEEYRAHKHKDKDGHEYKTYSWDSDGSWTNVTPTSHFMGHDYDTTSLGLPTYRVDLDAIGVSNYLNHIYPRGGAVIPSVGDIRWHYEATLNGITGSILTQLRDNNAQFLSHFYGYQTNEQVVADKDAMLQNGPMYFVLVWIFVIIFANLGVAYFRYKASNS